jgi:hypothetical protein
MMPPSDSLGTMWLLGNLFRPQNYGTTSRHLSDAIQFLLSFLISSPKSLAFSDHHRRGPAGDKCKSILFAIKRDPHRDALSQTHP